MENPRHPADSYDGSPRPPRKRPKENRFQSALRKPSVLIPLLLTLAFIIALVSMYFFKDAQVREAREQAAQERAVIIERANQRVAENNRYFLEVVAMPFSWALRSSLLSGNVEQVDQYLYQFIQDNNFELILVADSNGKIISSTNQRYTGASFAEHFNAEYLNAESTVVNDSGQNRIEMATPIMGFNSKLGTLLMVYLPGELMQVQQPVTTGTGE